MNNFLKCILVTWGFQGLQPATPNFILSTASPQSASSSQGSPRISSCLANLSSCDSSAWWSGASPWGAATVWEARVGITRGLRQLSPGKWHRETLFPFHEVLSLQILFQSSHQNPGTLLSAPYSSAPAQGAPWDPTVPVPPRPELTVLERHPCCG